jgi:undecaprenyl-diphosphatase
VARFLAHSGDSWFWIAGALIVGVVGNDAWKYRALVMGLAIILTAAIVLALKFLIHRPRPVGEWGGIYRKTDPHSFPSGHAARALLLSVLGLGLGPVWFAGLLLVWGPLVAVARVAMGVHYLFDILAGALLGAFLGWVWLQILPPLLQSILI